MDKSRRHLCIALSIAALAIAANRCAAQESPSTFIALESQFGQPFDSIADDPAIRQLPWSATRDFATLAAFTTTAEPAEARPATATVSEGPAPDDSQTTAVSPSEKTVDASQPARRSWNERAELLIDNGEAAAIPDEFSQPLDLQALAIRLTIGSLAVSAVGVVIIVLGKRLIGGRLPMSGQSNRIQPVATLQLSGRSHLRLVQIDTHRVLLGVDGSGLKSMLLLPESFTTRLDSFDEEPQNQNDSFDRRSAVSDQQSA